MLDKNSFEEVCAEARKLAFSFKNPLIVHHYDSVTGDNHILAEFMGNLSKYSVRDLFNSMKREFGSHTREDGKEIVKPEKLKVFAFDGTNVNLTPVRTLISHLTRKKIISLETSTYKVKLTNDHSIISLKDNVITAVKPFDSDFICSPVKFNFGGARPIIDLIEENLLPDKKRIFISEDNSYFFVKNKKRKARVPTKIVLDEKFMTFLGLWVADGCFMSLKGREGIRISAYDDKETKEVIEYIFSLFGSTLVIVDEGITAVTCNKTFFNLMRYLDFNDGSKEKKVPSWIFGIDKKLMAAFLRGYFSGDGTVSKGDVNATTYSTRLKDDLVSLLLFFGVRAKVRNDVKNGKKLGWKISINNKEYKHIFLDNIGFLQHYKNEKISFGLTASSNIGDVIPVSESVLFELKRYVLKALRGELTRLIRRKFAPTRHILLRILEENIPEDKKQLISDLLAKEIYFERIIKKEIDISRETIVYDVETETGNFVCENLILKNTDGISAGAIVISAFRTEFKTHRHIWIKKLDDSTFSSIEKEKEIIFVDLGSGNERVNELKDVLIIDHHQPKEVKKFQVNPLLFGIDGGTELSSSGTAYCVFKNHIDLAIVGAIGDMQYPLIGKNREILKEGIKSRLVGLDNDLRLYGRSSRPLPQFLAYSDEVYIPGITYKEENAVKFLEDLKIELKKGEVWRNYIDLSEEERNRLRKSLVTFLVDSGYEERAKQLIGEIYLLKKRPIRSDLYDVSEFSTILNACGRHGKAEIGIGVCLEEEEAYKEALVLLKHHKNMIREGILYARGHLQDLGSILFLDGRKIIDEGIIGIVCGMISPPFSKKPILGISNSEKDTIKVSTRASSTLVKEGINLGKILSISAGKVGGIGGGHRMAAGATVPSCKLEEFLVEFSKELVQKTN